MKKIELMVPGLLVCAFIVVTGVGMLVGAWIGNANAFFIGILSMLWIIAILLSQILRVLWEIRDKR